MCDSYCLRAVVVSLSFLLFSAVSLFASAANLPDSGAGAAGGKDAVKEPLASANRPSAVPEGYVITPFGYFHPSCVQSLAVGERLLRDGRVQHADGSLEQLVAVCNYPRYSPTGFPVIEGATTFPPPEISGWLENANVTTGSATTSYGALVARWVVPSQPTANDGQVLYLFPGFEDINSTQTILQPVLGWYQGQWTIASWNCCLNGVTSNSPPVNVSPGDQIYGSVTTTCGAGTLECATWNVLSLDMTTGDSTILADTPNESQVFNWAFGGVLEPYYIVSCADYPANGQLSFTNITVFNENLKAVSKPTWSTGVGTGTPQCNYAVKDTSNTVTLSF